jgi:hypothetical protein
MRVKVEDITEALNEIRAMVADEKSVSGVLLRFWGNTLDLCCTTGKKAIIRRIEIEDCAENGLNIVVGYDNIYSVVNSCQPKGSIVVNELEFELLKGVSAIRFTIVKNIKVVKDNEENFILGGVNSTDIGYKQANDLSSADMKVKVLTRVDYDGLYNVEAYDEYTVSELKDTLGRLTGEKNKVVYVSPKNESAFVAYTNFTAVVPISDKKIALVIPVGTAKAMMNVLGKMSDDTVLKVGTEKQFIRITDGDVMASMWEMGSVVENHITVLSRYKQKDYKTFMIDMHREMLLDTLSSIMNSTGSEKTKMEFHIEDGECSVSFNVSSSNSSIKGGYKVMCEGVIGNIPDVGYEVSLKCIVDMISECNSDYIGFDFNIDTNNGVKTLRISEMDIDKRMNETYTYKEAAGIDADEPIGIEEKMNIKEKCLGAKMYTLVK